MDMESTTDFALMPFDLKHDTRVITYKLKEQNYFEVMSKYVPNVLAVVTADYKVHLWVESLSQTQVNFHRFETIIDFMAGRIFPCLAFFRKNYKDDINPCQLTDVKLSKLVNVHSDRIYFLMKESNDIGVCKSNYCVTTNDWLGFITNESFYVYNLKGLRNYPVGVIEAYKTLTIVNSLKGAKSVCEISGVLDIEMDLNMIHICGYTSESYIGLWRKNLGVKTDSPCKLEVLLFQENKEITHYALHSSLPLILTVSQQNHKQLILISYELKNGFINGGYFEINEKVLDIYWTDYLPLIVILTDSNKIIVVGPKIASIDGDLPSFTSVLSYCTNTCSPYNWKSYSDTTLETSFKSMLHINTFTDKGLYQEEILLFDNNLITLAIMLIKDTKDNIDVSFKLSNPSTSKTNSLISKYVLKFPVKVNESFKFCIQDNKHLRIFTGKSWTSISEWAAEENARITLPETVELIRINSYQSPLIAIMDKSKLVKMYDDTGKYLGYMNLLEVHKKLLPKLDTKLANVSFQFYNNENSRALVVLFNQKLVLLCNNYRYEIALDFSVVGVLEKCIPYEMDAKIIGLEQASDGSIVLCTNMKKYWLRQEANKSIREMIERVNQLRPIYYPELLKEYLTFGDLNKLNIIIMQLYKALKKHKEEKCKDKVERFLGISITEVLQNVRERKPMHIKSEGSSILDNFATDFDNSELATKPKAAKPNIDIEEVTKIKDELLEMLNTSSFTELNDNEIKELSSLITSLKDFSQYKKSEDEITQELLLHINFFNVRWSLGQQFAITTMDVTLAYHCSNQDMILKLFLEPLGTYSWNEVTKFGIPLWLRDDSKLKEIVEAVARTEYQMTKEKDVERVNAVCLWYIVLQKKNVLSNLYKNTRQGGKIYELISHDFSEERWKKAASRNAYQLYSQKKYKMAAAFYLLGGGVNEAVQVAINHLKDLSLAVTICRLAGEAGQTELKKIYKEYFIEKGMSASDPWITSLGHWLCGGYIESLNCIVDILSQEESVVENELDPRLNVFYKEETIRKRTFNEEWSFTTPALSTFNASVIILCRKLKKHYFVNNLNNIGEKFGKEEIGGQA